MPVVVDTSHLGKKSSVGSVLGSLSSAGLSALIKLILEGRLGQVPTGRQSLQLPSGGTATPGPGLQNQIRTGQLPALIQSGQFPQGTTTVPQTRFGVMPDLSKLLIQSQIAANTARAAQLSQPNQVIVDYDTDGNPIYSAVPGKLVGGKPTDDELTKAITALTQNIPSGSTVPVTSEDRVKVRNKSGKLFSVPRTQIEEAKKQGYVLAE